MQQLMVQEGGSSSDWELVWSRVVPNEQLIPVDIFSYDALLPVWKVRIYNGNWGISPYNYSAGIAWANGKNYVYLEELSTGVKIRRSALDTGQPLIDRDETAKVFIYGHKKPS